MSNLTMLAGHSCLGESTFEPGQTESGAAVLPLDDLGDNMTPTPPTDAEKDKREVMDWAEARGLEYLKEHMDNVDALKTDSSTLLTILITAVGAILAYVIKAPENHAAIEMVSGAITLLVYLFVLGAVLITKCLAAKKASSINNSASNLYQNGKFTLAELKPAEFKNMEERARILIDRNKTTAFWLNRVRYAALCSPAVFLLGYAVIAAANHCRLLA